MTQSEVATFFEDPQWPVPKWLTKAAELKEEIKTLTERCLQLEAENEKLSSDNLRLMDEIARWKVIAEDYRTAMFEIAGSNDCGIDTTITGNQV